MFGRRATLAIGLVIVSACLQPVAPASATGKGVALPLPYPTGHSRQVITVVVASAHATRGTLQAWERHGHGWRRALAAQVAYVGQDGVRANPMEGQAITPAGSFTLTQAFGRLPDPGTQLPYLQTDPHDWWISEPGPYYNTYQRCTVACPFAQASPNTQLYELQPQYWYAVVIDYNRFPVQAGHGSGYFLHVTRGQPTAGCVSTTRAAMATLLRWFDPATHPRILIGVAA